MENLINYDLSYILIWILLWIESCEITNSSNFLVEACIEFFFFLVHEHEKQSNLWGGMHVWFEFTTTVNDIWEKSEWNYERAVLFCFRYGTWGPRRPSWRWRRMKSSSAAWWSARTRRLFWPQGSNQSFAPTSDLFLNHKCNRIHHTCILNGDE